MSGVTWVRKTIHYHCWMLIERICAIIVITAIIHPLFSDQTSTTPFYTTRIVYLFHWFWNYLSSIIVLSQLIKYFYLDYVRPADSDFSLQSNTNPSFCIPECFGQWLAKTSALITGCWCFVSVTHSIISNDSIWEEWWNSQRMILFHPSILALLELEPME